MIKIASNYELIPKKRGISWLEKKEKILKTLHSDEEAKVLLVFNGLELDRFTA